MTRVFDASILLGFYRDQPIADEVERFLVRTEKAKQKILITSLTWGELYFGAMQKSPETAERFAREISSLPVAIYQEHDDLSLTREAMRLRMTHKTNDLSALYSIALTKIKRAELWTMNRALSHMSGDIRIRILG